MSKLLVDFNSVDTEGRIRSRVSRADGPLDVGQVVGLYDDEGHHAKGVVAALDHGQGTVRVELDSTTWSEETRIHYHVDPRVGLMVDGQLILAPSGAPSTAGSGTVKVHVTPCG